MRPPRVEATEEERFVCVLAERLRVTWKHSQVLSALPFVSPLTPGLF